jgi:hypothetical protein
MDEFVESVRDLELANESANFLNKKIEELTIQMEDQLRPIDDQIEKQQEIIDGVQERIDDQQELNKLDRDRIRTLSREAEMLNRQVEQQERLNESDKRRIDSLNRENEIRQRVADALSRELEKMDRAETEIRDAYEDRIKALDEIASLNDYIANQQKDQISLAKELSQGDIYAAAAAAQTMQQATAGFAREQIRAGLDESMNNQIAGLRTAGGLTREQAEQRIQDIKDQIYQTSLQIRDIEDVIYQRNLELIPIKDQIRDKNDQIRNIQDAIYDRETQILKITREELEPAQNVLKTYEDQRTAIQEKFNDQVDALELAESLDDATLSQIDNVSELAQAWYDVKKQIKEAQMVAAREITDLGSAPPRRKGEKKVDYEARLAKFEEKRQRNIDRIKARERAAIDAAMGEGNALINNYSGGFVPGEGGRDSVMSRLTPGEFVVRSAMVKKYGAPMFEKINQGAFNMPRYDLGQAVSQPQVNSANSVSSINAPVYNTYDMKFNIQGANADPDQIAHQVMMKIRNIDNTSVRRINGY